MSCCGDARRSYAAQLGGPFAKSVIEPGESPPAESEVDFEYVGRTALTVRGPFSGRLYRFDRPGARLATDPRDQRALATVPALRPVRGR